MITKLENTVKATYSAVIGDKTVELPLTYTNITQAAAWLDKRTEAEKEIRIYERFSVITAEGEIEHRIHDVTKQCIDILWNYYEGN